MTTVPDKQSEGRVPCRLLVVAPGPAMFESVRSMLSVSADSEYVVAHAETLAASRTVLENQPHDVVLVERSAQQGLDEVLRLSADFAQPCIVLLTEHDRVRTAGLVPRQNSVDFLGRGGMNTESLELAVRHVLTKKRVCELEEELRATQDLSTSVVHAERLAALGELAAGIAHELNQPLNGIKLTCQSLLRYQESLNRQQMREDLDEVLGLVSSMAETIAHLRAFTNSDSSRMRALEANQVVVDTLRLVQQQFCDDGIVVITTLGEGLPALWGNAVQLGQVVLNLLTNARDSLCDASSGEEKRITIETGRIASGALATGEGVTIAVRDTGPGVPFDLRHKIFEPFVSTKPPGTGTGLGLAIAAKVVAQHGGYIEVPERAGDETVFRVVLPLRANLDIEPAPRSSRVGITSASLEASKFRTVSGLRPAVTTDEEE